MRYKYRHLSSAGYLDRPSRGSAGLPIDNPDEIVSTVRELGPIEEGEGTVAEITDKLRRGELSPHDLVDLGEGFRSLEDCDEFADACAPLEARLERKEVYRGLRRVGLIAALAVLVAGARIGCDIVMARTGVTHGKQIPVWARFDAGPTP